MNNLHLFRRLFLIVTALNTVTVAFSQNALIRGHVIDQPGAVVLNAEVNVTDQQTEPTRNMPSNNDFFTRC